MVENETGFRGPSFTSSVLYTVSLDLRIGLSDVSATRGRSDIEIAKISWKIVRNLIQRLYEKAYMTLNKSFYTFLIHLQQQKRFSKSFLIRSLWFWSFWRFTLPEDFFEGSNKNGASKKSQVVTHNVVRFTFTKEEFQFSWLNITAIYAAFSELIRLFLNHLK